MKRIKKLAAAMLTAIMMMTMTVTAYAAEQKCTLTVNVKTGEGVPTQTLKDQTINLYKLFDVTESKSGETTNYAYTVNTEAGYKDALASVLGGSITSSSKDEEFASAVLALGKNNAPEVQNFANKFTEYALTKGLAATATSGKISGENTTSYPFNKLAAGYYLVYVTGGKEIQSSLVTVDAENTTVNLKTEAPSITKEADKDTVEIGQVVKYTVTGSIPDTTGYDQYQYIVHDELSNGLDFVNDKNGTALGEDATTVNVKVAFTNGTDASTAPTTADLDTANNKKMSLDLSAWVRDNQANKGKEFTVTYYAKVNANAVVTEKNKAQLEYGNKPGETTKTTPSEVKTPTYPLDINKIKKDANPEEKLAGAKFKLYRNETDAKTDKNAIAVSGSKGNYVVDPTSTTTEFESVKSIEGKGYNLHVNGLEAKDYWLVETKAPDGFNKLTNPIKVTITKTTDAEWTVSKDGTVENDKIIDVENSTGSLLPSTGGTGVIVFAGVAILLVFGVVVSFIRDKRKAC
ncbi:SpaH/EbpB family LPXTG-anchored major pilin [Holdemanella biformis]|uniref:SpaH/EbpB family LPXTG-anchored major pilin n=1 Tax=Holdemanella biformis TaxID=1735 RepID=UPI0022DF5C9F|nr:SpaH/EbpB family LPXTG-anchored major pilin [Holdemanella biformis]